MTGDASKPTLLLAFKVLDNPDNAQRAKHGDSAGSQPEHGGSSRQASDNVDCPGSRGRTKKDTHSSNLLKS
jgi:hypothetical protein